MITAIACALFVLAAIAVWTLFVVADDRDYWRSAALRLAEENRAMYAALESAGEDRKAAYRESLRICGDRVALWDMVWSTKEN